MAEGNGRQWAADIKDIGDKIAALTVSKAVELGDYLEEVHKIKPAAGAVAVAAPVGGGAAPAAAAAPVKDAWAIQLDSFGADKIKVIKVVRELTGLGLKEAKDLVEGAPKMVKEGLTTEDEAKKIQKQLEDVGAKVSIK
jgi:large subunit ribosomal protein L7/L12